MASVRTLHRELDTVYKPGVFGEGWVQYKENYAGENNPKLCKKIEAVSNCLQEKQPSYLYYYDMQS